MRRVKIATCTSGEPVSFSLTRCSSMIFALSSVSNAMRADRPTQLSLCSRIGVGDLLLCCLCGSLVSVENALVICGHRRVSPSAQAHPACRCRQAQSHACDEVACLVSWVRQRRDWPALATCGSAIRNWGRTPGGMAVLYAVRLPATAVVSHVLRRTKYTIAPFSRQRAPP